jgi:hypothetical protein
MRCLCAEDRALTAPLTAQKIALYVSRRRACCRQAIHLPGSTGEHGGNLTLRRKRWRKSEKQGPLTRPFSCAHSSLAGCCASATATAGAAAGACAAGGAAATAGAGSGGNSGLGNGDGAGAGHGVSPVGGGWRKRVCRLLESSIHPPVEGRVKGWKGGLPCRTAKVGPGHAKESSAITSP